MKITGRIAVALMATVFTGAAFAASLEAIAPGAIGTESHADAMQAANDARSSTAQQAVIDTMMTKSGYQDLSRGRMQTAMVESTRGTLIPGLTYVANRVAANAAQQRVQNFVTNAINGQSIGGTALTAGQADYTLDLMNGQHAVGASFAASQTMGGIRNAVGSRTFALMQERRALNDQFGSSSAMASSIINQNYTNRFWAQGFHLRQDMDRKDNYTGYKYKATGGSVGYDRAFGAITAGAAFTYSRGDLEAKGAIDDNTIDNYGVSIYANYTSCSGFFTSVYGGYNYADNDLKRYDAVTAGWLSGDNHTNSWWGGGEVGYEARLSDNFALIPSVGIFYQHNKGSEYTFGGLQDIGNVTSKGWSLPINLTAEYRTELSNCSAITLKATGGYTYDFSNKGATGSFTYAGFNDGPGISIRGVKPGHSSWNVGGGIKYEYRNMDFSVDYRYDGRSKFDSHKIAAMVGVNF